MKTATLAILAIASLPVATLGLTLAGVAPATAFAIAVSIAIGAIAVDDLFPAPSRNRG